MSTQAYGFAVAAQLSDLLLPQEFRREKVVGISRATANGIAIAVRHYPATPESVREEQPLSTENTVLVYEGRVDNRQEIAYALGRPHLAHSPDGAVLEAAYQALGVQIVGQCRW